jgi:hypothetical protein
LSELPQTGGRRRFPMFALVILAGALISYTVVRLQGLSDRLPYDPGPPLPIAEVEPGNVLETLGRLRATFLDGRSARIPGDGVELHECWPLAGIEYERALRVLASMREQQPGPLCDALTALVEQRRAFVLEREVFPLTTGEHWRYWTHELFARQDRRRLLVVPIDLREFPQAR